MADALLSPSSELSRPRDGKQDMRFYEYKCQRCEERHHEVVALDNLADTHFLPCPVCGFVSRRVAVYVADEAAELRQRRAPAPASSRRSSKIAS